MEKYDVEVEMTCRAIVSIEAGTLSEAQEEVRDMAGNGTLLLDAEVIDTAIIHHP